MTHPIETAARSTRGPVSGDHSPVTGRPSLEAAFAATDLINAYAYHVDRLEPELVGGLFTEDCVVDYGGTVVLRGRTELAEHLGTGLGRFSATFHQNSNIRLHGSDDRIHAVTYVHAWHFLPGADPRSATSAPDTGSEIEARAQYHDTIVRQDGRWLIAERTLDMVAHSGVDGLWRGAARRTDALDPSSVARAAAVITGTVTR